MYGDDLAKKTLILLLLKCCRAGAHISGAEQGWICMDVLWYKNRGNKNMVLVHRYIVFT